MTQPIPRSDWLRLMPLLDQALDLPPRERKAWRERLALPTALDQALARLLAERLALETREFLTAMPQVVVDGDTAQSAPSPYAAGCTVGAWRLLRRLGQGGMSVVWLAERADGQMQRQVALKLPHAGPGRDLLARRMLRERRILAALEHPHIARLYDVGLADDGTPYLAMEYVQGDDLLTYADKHSLSVPGRVALFQQVLVAVQHAHGQLVLHRDIKPANMLVTATGQVKLLDFGIATLLVRDDGGGPEFADTQITLAGSRQLTPGYASPEQWLGQPLGTASDVYSLGVVLYELLCGSRPHETAPGAGAALEHAVLHDEPLPPSRRPMAGNVATARAGSSAAALGKALQGDLDSVALKALARAPQDRYASAEAMAADLQRWQTGRPLATRPRSALYVTRKYVQRHLVGVALGSAATVALLVMGAVALVQGQLARQEATRAATARDFVLQLLADAAPDRLGGVQLTATQLLEVGRQKAEAQLAGQPRLQAELLAGLGAAQVQVQDYSGADAALARAAALFSAAGDRGSEAHARLTRLEASLQDNRASEFTQLSKALEPLLDVLRSDRVAHLRWLLAAERVQSLAARDVAPRFAMQAAALADPADAKELPLLLRAHLWLAQSAAFRGDAAEVTSQLAKAAALPTGADPMTQAEHAAEIAGVRIDTDLEQRFAEHLQWLPTSIAACQQQFGTESRRCGELKLRQAWALLRMGEGRQALVVAEQLAPALSQSTARYARFAAAYQRVTVLAALGLTSLDEPAVQALLAMLNDESANRLPPLYQVPGLISMALLQLRAGDVDAAERWLALGDAVVATHGRETLKAESAGLDAARGLTLQARGRHREALAALGPRCQAPKPAVPLVNISGLNCVHSFVATGQKAQAVALVQATLARFTSSLGEDAPNTRRARQLLQDLQSPGYRQPAWAGDQIFISGIR